MARKGIHPDYKAITVTCVTCGTQFESGSVKKELRVDTCSNCHPFYTGTQRAVSADSRAEKFKAKYKMK